MTKDNCRWQWWWRWWWWWQWWWFYWWWWWHVENDDCRIRAKVAILTDISFDQSACEGLATVTALLYRGKLNLSGSSRLGKPHIIEEGTRLQYGWSKIRLNKQIQYELTGNKGHLTTSLSTCSGWTRVCKLDISKDETGSKKIIRECGSLIQQ